MLCPPITSELNQPVKGVEDNEGWLEEETEVEDETKKLSCMDQVGDHAHSPVHCQSYAAGHFKAKDSTFKCSLMVQLEM